MKLDNLGSIAIGGLLAGCVFTFLLVVILERRVTNLEDLCSGYSSYLNGPPDESRGAMVFFRKVEEGYPEFEQRIRGLYPKASNRSKSPWMVFFDEPADGLRYPGMSKE